MSLTPEEPRNIIGIDPESQRELEIRKSARDTDAERQCPGLHKSVVVDSKTRTLTCSHCGYVVDPFSYIEQWANDGERRMTGLRGIEAKRRVAFAEFTRLEQQIDNIRAALKRAGHPQPQKERDDYKNTVLNAEWKASRKGIHSV